jgi:hypothetical protein
VEYVLMHKNVPVMDMVIDETGYIAKLLSVHDYRHLPVGVSVVGTGVERKSLNAWWIGRSIPANRSRFETALQNIGVESKPFRKDHSEQLSLVDDLIWFDIESVKLLR